jgi:hypothetical protein
MMSFREYASNVPLTGKIIPRAGRGVNMEKEHIFFAFELVQYKKLTSSGKYIK